MKNRNISKEVVFNVIFDNDESYKKSTSINKDQSNFKSIQPSNSIF